MKIRGCVVSISFILPHPLGDKKEKKNIVDRFDAKPCHMVEVKPRDVRCHIHVKAIIDGR